MYRLIVTLKDRVYSIYILMFPLFQVQLSPCSPLGSPLRPRLRRPRPPPLAGSHHLLPGHTHHCQGPQILVDSH